MFEVESRGLEEMILKFRRLPAAERRELRQAMQRATKRIADQARANMARLFHNPERMQQTISTAIDEGTTTVTGTVKASGLPYLAIQEYGGVVQTPEIVPVNAEALHWLAPSALGFSGGPRMQEGVFAMHTAAHPTGSPSAPICARHSHNSAVR